MQHKVIPIAFINNRLTPGDGQSQQHRRARRHSPHHQGRDDRAGRHHRGRFQEVHEHHLRPAHEEGSAGEVKPTGAGTRRPALARQPQAVARRPCSTCCSPTSSATCSCPRTPAASDKQAGPDERVARTRPSSASPIPFSDWPSRRAPATSTSSRWRRTSPIRYRIDGVLQTVQNLPKKVQLGLISRLKISQQARHLREAPAAGRPHQRQ